MATCLRESVTRLVPLLERLSLLRINEAALERVVGYVQFASSLGEVNTDKIEPMVSPVVNQCVYMRPDQAETIDRTQVVKNATKLVEDYFVTPAEHKHYSKL